MFLTRSYKYFVPTGLRMVLDVAEAINDLAMRDEAIEEVAASLKGRAERGRRFAELTSLRVGGVVDWVLSPDSEEQAAALVPELGKRNGGWRALGFGSQWVRG